MALENKLGYSLWYDLFFHVMTHLPVNQSDASSIYDPGYVEWTDRHFPVHNTDERTLPQDTEALSSMYDQIPGAFQLYMFLLLYDDFETFSASVETPFQQLAFPDEQRTRTYEKLKKRIPQTMMELFRIALWSEAHAGYIQLHETHVVPLYNEGIPILQEAMDRMAETVRGFGRNRLIVSFPLRRYGRHLYAGSRSAIIIGLPSPTLDVPAWAPVLQACHEYVLSKVIDRFGISQLQNHDTRGGQKGFYYHMAPEITALSLQAYLYGQKMEDSYIPWLSCWLPPDCIKTAASLPWEIGYVPEQSGRRALVDWLASGEAVPTELQPVYRDLLQWFKNSDG